MGVNVRHPAPAGGFPMGIDVRFPSAPLHAYIECLWSWEGLPPYPRMAVLPRPSLHVMLNFGDAYHVYQVDEYEARSSAGADSARPCATCGASWAVGLRNRPHIMVWPRHLALVNISFRPGGAAPFLRAPLAELRDQLVPLDAIWGAAAAEVRERLGAQPTPQARLALLERLLRARLARLDGASPGRNPTLDPGLALVQHAVAQIARDRGTLSIDALSQQLGVSHKHLITQFQRLVGATPKALARLYRLQQVRDRLDSAVAQPRAQPLTWAEVPHEAGYFDEAHFARDFRALTSQTPGAYLRLLRRAHAEHPASARALTFLPAE